MNNNTINTNDCLDWDDSIENDGNNYIILEEGDYNYTVTNIERGRFPGGAKIPPCNKASLTLQVVTEDGIAIVHTDLFLHRSVEWKLSSFFRSIGQKNRGERMTMDWNHVIGCQGRAHITPRSYTNKNGDEKWTNDVTRFYDFDAAYFPKDNEEWMDISDDADELPFS